VKSPGQWQCMVLLAPRMCARRVMGALTVLAALGMGMSAAPSAKAQTYPSTVLFNLPYAEQYPFGGLIMNASGTRRGWVVPRGRSNHGRLGQPLRHYLRWRR
jgi:hypothetical protein